MSDRLVDVAVVGGGPAGHALASALAARGAEAVVVDPGPERRWIANYGAWADELPPSLPGDVVATRLSPTPVRGPSGRHLVDREYVMLDTDRLADHLRRGGHDVVAANVQGVRACGGLVDVLGAEGTVVRARTVVDATGERRLLTGGPASPPRAEQSAYGLAVAADTLRADQLAFMDWRPAPGAVGWPSFLYAVPVAGDRVLLEETSLARRPGLAFDVLQRRLEARLAELGIDVADDAPVERVRFTVDAPRTAGSGRVVAFGATAPTVHPATGYSLAATLRLAGPVASAIVDRLPDGEVAAAAARHEVWQPGARVVHHLRRRGLEVLLALPPAGVADFFDLFFELPVRHQRAYLSERERPRPVMAAMAAVFAAADGPLRRHLVRWGAVPWGEAPAPDQA